MGQNLSAVIQTLIPKTWFGATKQIGNVNADANGSLVISGLGGVGSSLAITAGTPAIVKAGPGMVCALTVIAAGSGVGTINDCTATAAATTANQMASIPETVGTYQLNFPALHGIVVTPGTGQQVSLSYQ